ncbi:MAG: DegV family protein [Chloroflexi bacterium]|nr:DegV family protein [Chloroflexota bacterium]
MNKVSVVTDSCASIPEPLLQKLQIHTVAYYIHRQGEALRDLVNVQRDEFLRWLASASTLPTTACPGPGDYLEAYKSLIKRGFEQIVSIHMTSRGSGAYQSAKTAQSMIAQRFPAVRLEVVDTLNVSLCQGWIAIEAARAALEGVSLDEILAKIQRMIPITQMIQTADTLRYLYMGGRIGMAKRLLGTLLNVKPLIGMKDGVIQALGQARSRMGAYREMAEYVSGLVGTNKVKIAYVHAGAMQEAERLKSVIESKLDIAESFIAELSPALSVHTGPGTVGICFYPVE